MENKENVECSFCSKNRRQVKKMVAAPTHEHTGYTAYICNECIDMCKDMITKSVFENLNELTPSLIKAQLDRFVIGQDSAKKSISIAVYNHIKRVNNLATAKFEKSNVLLIGPTGTGKTLLAKTVANAVGVPYAIADATTLTESGYQGDDVDSMVYSLCENADWNVTKAQMGIIFIDEVDKLAKKSEGSQSMRDVSGEGVQQALLKLVEGKSLQITDPSGQTVNFDTTNVLFIASGSFVGLPDVIKDRLKQPSIGFGKDVSESRIAALKDLISEDLEKFGMLPEFIGRMPIISILEDLNEDLLYRILIEPENCLVEQYQSLFKLEGVELTFDDLYCRHLAGVGYKRKTGARGLRAEIERALEDTQYLLPELVKEKGANRVSIDHAGVPHISYKPAKKRIAKT